VLIERGLKAPRYLGRRFQRMPIRLMTYLKCGLAISMVTTADCRSLEPLEPIGICFTFYEKMGTY